MKLATLGMKKALIAGALVTGTGAFAALAGPALLDRDANTNVAGTQVVAPPAVDASAMPSPAPRLGEPDASTAHAATPQTTTTRTSGTRTAQPQPSPAPEQGGTVGVAPAGGSRGGNGGQKPPANSPDGFEIKGNVTGLLYPGVVNDLTVTLENPYSFAIELVSASVTVGTSGTCSGEHLWIDGTKPSSSGRVDLPTAQRVGGNGEARFTVTAELQNSAGDNCQNATFPLTYAARAVKG